MGRSSISSSSSMDSSRYPYHSSASSICQRKTNLSTDLRLGLGVSTNQEEISSTSRENYTEWSSIHPPCRIMRPDNGDQSTFFAKVYMEGISIGRKVDLLKFDGYEGLVQTLQQMFGTNILCSDSATVPSSTDNVLTYEDQEGDWMLVGDIPWELFLTTVKRMKIITTDRC